MRVIGLTTKYLGEEFPGLCGREVRVLAVLRGALLPYVDRGDAGRCLTDDEAVARAGGVKEFDRVAIAMSRRTEARAPSTGRSAPSTSPASPRR